MKKVELIIEIDSTGKIKVTPKGTMGPECIELMAFLDKIDGINVLETIANEDFKKVIGTTKNRVVEKNEN